MLRQLQDLTWSLPCHTLKSSGLVLLSFPSGLCYPPKGASGWQSRTRVRRVTALGLTSPHKPPCKAPGAMSPAVASIGGPAVELRVLLSSLAGPLCICSPCQEQTKPAGNWKMLYPKYKIGRRGNSDLSKAGGWQTVKADEIQLSPTVSGCSVEKAVTSGWATT